MKDIEKTLELVKSLNDERNFEKTIETLDDKFLEISKNANLYIEKARALGNLEKYEDCKFYSEKALEIDSTTAKAYYYIGRVYSSFYRNYKKAIEYYIKALEFDTNDSNIYERLGHSYFNLKEYEKAKEFYEHSLKIESNNSQYLHGLGNVYLSLKQYDEAIERFQKAIELDESYYVPYNNLGNAYYGKEMYDLAIENYNKYIIYNPTWSGSYRNRAMCFFYLEKYAESLKDYEKYVEIDEEKNNFKYKNALNRIEEIENILANKDYEEITEIIIKVKDLLSYKDGCITHFTSLSTAKFLVINNSPFRLSEGTFLNDTSEGTALFKYLTFQSVFKKHDDTVDELFTQKPFIGSFVSEAQHNDLAMWRMYGKEQQEEAKGCAITIDILEYINKILESLSDDDLFLSFDQDFTFYRVSYINDGKFIIPDIKKQEQKGKGIKWTNARFTKSNR